ncbi:TPA: hypothetical protein JBH76_09245 [Legionella pneumophila]|nr:hypothetical protein [Legionella pneumophila]HAU0970376.1 hypothetical protein [Legionella pneumophila]HAU1556474.1 hypothetical protein [Legionella pneumophila]HAU1699077.1 hypothetical protein [Legionella pneumophila]HAU1767115.1 hypothetical protein [Legionella pneumophila]
MYRGFLRQVLKIRAKKLTIEEVATRFKVGKACVIHRIIEFEPKKKCKKFATKIDAPNSSTLKFRINRYIIKVLHRICRTTFIICIICTKKKLFCP